MINIHNDVMTYFNHSLLTPTRILCKFLGFAIVTMILFVALTPALTAGATLTIHIVFVIFCAISQHVTSLQHFHFTLGGSNRSTVQSSISSKPLLLIEYVVPLQISLQWASTIATTLLLQVDRVMQICLTKSSGSSSAPPPYEDFQIKIKVISGWGNLTQTGLTIRNNTQT